jgi:hypothetical protein
MNLVDKIHKDIALGTLGENVAKHMSSINYTINEQMMKNIMSLDEAKYVYGGISGYLYSLLTVQSNLRALVALTEFKDHESITTEMA